MNDLEIRELVLKIMNEAMDKTENTKADVFVDFQAHVKELVLRILKSGWKNRKVEEEIYKSVYLNDPGAIEQLEEMYNLINFL